MIHDSALKSATAPIAGKTNFPAKLMVGASAILLAVAFNIPFAILAKIYNYPDVLRGSASDALNLFAQAGPVLIWTWYAFAICALALIPLSIALSITPDRLKLSPALAAGAAITGSLSGLTQAIGLMRWVFVVPHLSAVHADAASGEAARVAAESAFDLLNNYGGVAIGEHLGQLLLGLFIVQVAMLQFKERQFITSALGVITTIAIVVGTGEGLALALNSNGDVFSLFTITGFLGFTVWLIASGIRLIIQSARS